MTAADRC